MSYLVSSFSCWCCDVEQKNKSSKLTFCIKTTHNWFNRMTSRFSTSVGYLTPKLDVRIFKSGRKNDSCTSRSWWREWVTNCSYSFNCSNRTASEYLQMKWKFFSVYCYDFRNHANKCHETRKFHNLRTYVGAKSCPNLTFRLFYSIHKAYQEDSHSAKIRGKVTVVRPVKLAADTYCNYAIPTATMWPYDPCD